MAKQAQSRMKLLEKIQGEAVDVDFDDPSALGAHHLDVKRCLKQCLSHFKCAH